MAVVEAGLPWRARWSVRHGRAGALWLVTFCFELGTFISDKDCSFTFVWKIPHLFWLLYKYAKKIYCNWKEQIRLSSTVVLYFFFLTDFYFSNYSHVVYKRKEVENSGI